MPSDISEQLVEDLSSRLDRYLDDLKVLTSTDCPTSWKPGLDAVVEFIATRLTGMGADVEIIAQAMAGNDLIGRFHGSGEKRVLMLCHTDTVYPLGTVAERPFRIDGDHVLAPGACDMKGGLLSAIYSVEALKAVGYSDFREIVIVCNSDEEAPPRHSLELIHSSAQEADCVFTMEPARINGDVVSARKGVVVYTLTAHGREAHAGVTPESGRSAVVAMADRLLELWKLNGMRTGLTVNPGVMHGGTAANTVAGEAKCLIDLRVSRSEDVAAFEAAAHTILETSIIPDVSFELHAEVAMPPLEKTEASARLVDLAQQAASELGFEVRDTSTGGGSDGAYAAETGTPVLDGLGPIGGHAHSEREFLDVDSIVPRTAMLARLVTLV